MFPKFQKLVNLQGNLWKQLWKQRAYLRAENLAVQVRHRGLSVLAEMVTGVVHHRPRVVRRQRGVGHKFRVLIEIVFVSCNDNGNVNCKLIYYKLLKNVAAVITATFIVAIDIRNFLLHKTNPSSFKSCFLPHAAHVTLGKSKLDRASNSCRYLAVSLCM